MADIDNSEKRKNIAILILSFLLVCFIIINALCVYRMDFEIPFDKAGEFDIGEKTSVGKTDAYWVGLRHPKYGGFYSEEILDAYNININLDFNKYTYIVTFGHELKRISYSYNTMKNRKLVFIPKQFIGKVVLLEEFKDKVYVYRIPTMDIDCDFHERDRKIYFVKDVI